MTARSPRVCLIGTYTPRHCGIATFTADLRAGLEGLDPPVPTEVIALTNRPGGYDYGDEVVFEIHESQLSDYRAAAEFINHSGFDLVCLQHEFGIFGGKDGRYITELLAHVRAPVVTTLHTVVSEPEPGVRESLRAVAAASERLIVLNSQAVPMLRDAYGIEERKVLVIPHGVPDTPFVDPSYSKDTFDADGRFVLLTFGLLSAAKGIEVVLDALPDVVATHPELLYVVLGATHPEVRRQEGEAYRESLLRQVADLGLEDNVRFYDHYVGLEELVRFLGAADLYVTPYHSREQIVSGTLAYAVGLGRAVVSTPYRYASELLADGRGRLFDFGDSAELSRALLELMEDDATRNTMRRRAYQYARDMTWPAVSRRHAELFGEVLAGYEHRPARRAPESSESAGARNRLPSISLDHLVTLTDDTGIIQHAPYGVPDRRLGYTTDDAGRALVVAVQHHRLFGDDLSQRLATTYLSYLLGAQQPDGAFANVLTWERTWVEGSASEDTLGQALWGLGAAVAAGGTESFRALACELFHRALPAVAGLRHPKAVAYAMHGLYGYLERFPGALLVQRALQQAASHLERLYNEVRQPGWQWFEDQLTYANAKVPQAMLLASRASDCDRWRGIGLESLDFLLAQTWRGERFDFVGNEGWQRCGGPRPAFGQQPIEAGYTAEACMVAYEVTGNVRYLERATSAIEWFTGRNRLGAALYDPTTGMCVDGLDRHGVSHNGGAESTICCLLGLLAAPAVRRVGEAVAPVATTGTPAD